MNVITAAINAASKKFVAARTSLVLDQPFFGSLALNLKPVQDATCKTAWTDGRSLGYNPAYADGLTFDALVGLVGHEVMHCAMGHQFRRDGRDFKKWNTACDVAINDQLREAGFSLPDGALYPEGDEAGKSAEWIFARRFQSDQPGDTPQPKPQPEDEQEETEGEQPGEPSEDDGDESGDGDGPGNEPGEQEGEGDGEGEQPGEVRDAPTTPDADGDEAPTEQEWKERTAAAAVHAKMMGKLPAGMARAVEQALKPAVDVRSLLLRFFTERAQGDYSWKAPNTRYIAQGLYLPSLYSEELGEVAIMVDTSGSMGGPELQNARAIVESVIEECNPARVSIYYADAEVCRVDHFEKGEPLEWQPQGGGGTDFRPALEAIERDETPVCVVCITDLYGAFPEQAPDIPVLWLSTSESMTAPFGETVYTAG